MFLYRIDCHIEWGQHSLEHPHWNRLVVAESEMDARAVLTDYLYRRGAKDIRITMATLEIASPLLVKGRD